jgi:predicted flap endonuclease-1-like 5' DNA nuclease
MGLLDKLRSLFGSDRGGQSPARGTDADVTIEHEPAAESEHAVKGTDTGRQQRSESPQRAHSQESHQPAGGQPTDQQPAPETEEAGETEEAAETDETAETEEIQQTAGTDESEGDANSPPVEEIKGIGPTYAERLEEAGIATVSDLAAVDPTEAAEAAETGETRAGDWVERAQDF